MARRKDPIPPADLGRVKQESLKKRKNLVSIDQFVRPSSPDTPAGDILSFFPNLLAGKNLRKLVSSMLETKKSNGLVGAAFGAHVIKCGLSPLVIDLMERGFLNALSFHGAGAVHDFEIACIGATSEDVATGLEDGSFGMARETFEALNRAAEEGAMGELGFGAALGKQIEEESLPYREQSILAAAYRLGIPATVHVAIGTDIVHMHPGVSAEALGRATHTDFRILVSVASRLEGGVWLNIGSAVILPEVFMKALNIARNLGCKVQNLFTANLDMLQHYRPRVNVVTRPAEEGVAITCHHEILLPILRLALLGAEQSGKERE